jgi:two-component system response regulator NreC
MSTRVVMADDHKMLAGLLKGFLETEGFSVVGLAEDGAEAVKMVRTLRPNVVVLDLSMPIMNGIEAAAEIRRESNIPCLLLTCFSDEQSVQRAFSAGFAGYILKSKTATDLVEAIREVLRGNYYISPGISQTVIRGMLNKEPVQADVLTLRERQVLQLIAEGNTTKEIAVQMGISVRTGESHRSRIMDKLSIHETAGLVRYAIRRGLITV